MSDSGRPRDQMDSSSTGSIPETAMTVVSTNKEQSTAASTTPSNVDTASSKAATEASSGPEVKPGRGNGDGEAHSDDYLSKNDPWWKLMKCLATEGKVNRALGNVVDLGGESE